MNALLDGHPENHAHGPEGPMSIHVVVEMTKLQTWRLVAGGWRQWGRRMWREPSKWDRRGCVMKLPGLDGTKVSVRTGRSRVQDTGSLSVTSHSCL